LIVDVSDSQVVAETQGVLFTIIQPAPISVQLIIKNSGQNTMNYDFQEWNGTAWSDLGAVGTVLNTTLTPNQVTAITLTSSNSKIQMLGYASGGAFLEFSLKSYFNRQSGGAIPVLTL
jgi:hypothetical protein